MWELDDDVVQLGLGGDDFIRRACHPSSQRLVTWSMSAMLWLAQVFEVWDFMYTDREEAGQAQQLFRAGREELGVAW